MAKTKQKREKAPKQNKKPFGYSLFWLLAKVQGQPESVGV
jgi:hypothetical protein